MKLNDQHINEMVAQVINSKKYRQLGLNPTTVTDLIQQEAAQQTTPKATLKAVRRKLHNIVAPYLGQLDYAARSAELLQIEDYSLTSKTLITFCLDVLAQHASTAERIPTMAQFYAQLFEAAGQPQSIIDLACGLNPLAFPWMGLPLSVRYYAYDILQPRVDFINQFFAKIGLAPLAENQDILVNPPEQSADLGLFLKEAHRFEKRQPGCNYAFWAALNVRKLAVSLPSTDLTGSHSLLEQHRKLVRSNLPPDHTVQEIQFENEIIFLIDNPGVAANG